MSKEAEVYKCESCGAIIEVIQGGAGKLVCCNAPMALQAENTVDAAVEKHVPVVEKVEGGIKVKVGEVAHPMEGAHYIQWIEVIACGQTLHRTLKPGDAPEAVFNLCCCNTDEVTVRAYCNSHGLWKA
jgi:superoxide reductase